MKNRNVRLCLSVILPLGVSVSLVAAAGCGGDDTVRGAGSIDVPRPSMTIIPEQAAARPGKTAGNPPRAR
jgi:hypothetical protein